MILLTGAAGKTGKAIIRSLSEYRLAVKALVFRPEQIQPVKALGVKQVFAGDLTNKEIVRNALQDVDSVYLICPNIHPEEEYRRRTAEMDSYASRIGLPLLVLRMQRAARQAQPEAGQVRRGNVMARMRMIVLYDQSEAFHGLAVGTGNKTEILLGYTTIYGDSACAINPLGDLYKTQVRQLSRDPRRTRCCDRQHREAGAVRRDPG